jgi:hypothetical protein
METKTEKKPRKAGKRSPGYPMISLEEAIEKAKVLWDKDKNNVIPIDAAYEHLGYKAKGGYGARILAALKKFGLISDSQNGIRLTSDAVDLMLHEPGSGDYENIIGKLFLKPSIYEKLYGEYEGQLPSDATLRVKLIKDYEFNPDSVEDFINGFRRTIEFARIAENKEIRLDKKNTKSDERSINTSLIDSSIGGFSMLNTKEISTETSTIRPPGKSVMEIPIPISLTEAVIIKTPYPLTEQAWNHMLSILNAYKPTLVPSMGKNTDESKEN